MVQSVSATADLPIKMTIIEGQAANGGNITIY